MEKSTIIKASEIIFGNEGGYTSVNADDNGAVSVGRIQWHGTRALNLLKKIVKALSADTSEQILGDELHREIKDASSWSKRVTNGYETDKLRALLGTSESKSVQDAQAEADITSYLVHIENLGVEEENAQIFMADIENQGGAGASTRIIRNAEGRDLDSLYLSAKADSIFSRYTARRNRVYTKLTGHPFGEEPYTGKMHEVLYGDTLSKIGVKYGVPWREIAVLNNISNPDHIRVGDLLKIPIKAKEPVTHKVIGGDTLSKIAKKHNTTVDAIVAANKTKYPRISRDYIVKGWVLTIPGEDT